MSLLILELRRQKKKQERKERNRVIAEKKRIKQDKIKKKREEKKRKEEESKIVIRQEKTKKKPQKQLQSPSVKKLIEEAEKQRKELKKIGQETFSVDKKILKLLKAEKPGIRTITEKKDLNRLKKLLDLSSEIRKGPISNSLVSSNISPDKVVIFSTNQNGLNGVLVYKSGKTVEIIEFVANRSGRQLINQLFKENKNKTFITDSTPNAVGFYEKFGFKKNGKKIRNLQPMIKS